MLLRPTTKEPPYGWGDFGGKAMPGETPRDTAIREAYEEVNEHISLEYLREHVSIHFDYIPCSKYALFSCELPPEFDYTVIEPYELHPVKELRESTRGAEYCQRNQRQIGLFSPNQIREFMFLQRTGKDAPVEKILHRRLSHVAVRNALGRLEAM